MCSDAIGAYAYTLGAVVSITNWEDQCDFSTNEYLEKNVHFDLL